MQASSLRGTPLHPFLRGHRSLSTLYSWGKSEHGELGRKAENKTNASRPTALNHLQGKTITGITAATRHAMVCTDRGEVYAWGSNKYSLLGSNRLKGLMNEQSEVPLRVLGLPENVVEVSAGECSSAALTKDGKLFTWGFEGSFAFGCGPLGRENDPNAPGRVFVGGEGADLRVKQIASGSQHMAALGLDGEVWIWGKGASGMMGDGRNSDRKLPLPVVYLLDTDVTIKQIACGSFFNMALDDEGLVYVWGRNEQGQLGLGGGFSMDMESVPRVVDALQGKEKIIHVAAGANHAVAVTENGEVYMWGYSTWTEPHKMSALQGKNIVKASCGYNFTCALSDAGEVFTWGKSIFVARTGVLGRPSGNGHSQPEIVKDLPESIADVSCGQRFTLAVSGLPERPL